jgi:hypothetical protein
MGKTIILTNSGKNTNFQALASKETMEALVVFYLSQIGYLRIHLWGKWLFLMNYRGDLERNNYNNI